MLRHALLFPLLCLVLPASAAAISIDERPIDTRTAKRIDSDVENILQRTGTPGATILIAEHGHVVYRHSYGLRDREHHVLTAVNTEYEIGSITKQFTAAAILQLQEAGKLHLDDKLSTYLPDAPHADEVTLRQLLSHTSGMPDYLDAVLAAKANENPASFDMLMSCIAGKPLDFAPGRHCSYSNTGYVMAGRVIEVVSRESYWHYVKTHLLDPAGMTHTSTVADEKTLPNMAIGYHRENGQFKPAGTIAASVGRGRDSLSRRWTISKNGTMP